MSHLTQILDRYRAAAVTPREQGQYFEELIRCYLRNEPCYHELYQEVWSYSDWAARQGVDQRDVGIDLVALVRGSATAAPEYHAIQCKLYAPERVMQKADIDSFFTASGQLPFTARIIVSTTDNWSVHAQAALHNQQPPVTRIDLQDLEHSKLDWSKYQPQVAPILKSKKQPRPHQVSAINAVVRGLATVERGRLIMACGTGKTFTSLKIAEQLAGKGGMVLFLVPSLALLSQTLTEWTQESSIPLNSFAVCSDSDIGKKRATDTDTVAIFTHELRYPATTNAVSLAKAVAARRDGEHMTVVFSTYHSIAVLQQAQQQQQLAAFDLLICDEAHRTTGVIFADKDESAFVRVHDASFIQGRKRLYMTATPRIYANRAKASAEVEGVTLCSMDDEKLYGPELHVLTFSAAVQLQLLVDYKVLVLAVAEEYVSRRLQKLLADEHNQLRMDDAAKIVGCWKALAKQGLTGDTKDDQQLPDDVKYMRRALAFCQVIEPDSGKSRTRKVSSKQIASMFAEVVREYQVSEVAADDSTNLPPVLQLRCEAEHVDGSMGAALKETKLQWLKAEAGPQVCRILTNVRCLTEGVDVPALDAVLFLTPRDSQIDVVQAVGRVMRRAPGKVRGYVVLPVVIPAGVEPHVALNDNRTYAVVWQVLQALRSHDDRFDAMINKLELTGEDPRRMEVIAIVGKLPAAVVKAGGQGKGGKGKFGSGVNIGTRTGTSGVDSQSGLQFAIGEIERAIYAKVVQKVGNRQHWEEWAVDIARIATSHMARLQAVLAEPSNVRERAAFATFAQELRADVNVGLADVEIVEMLAQHLITKPVFEALFAGYDFVGQNPLSRALQGVITVLQGQHVEKEAASLQEFYASVQLRAAGIDSMEGRQRIVLELYDKFFRGAFPKLTERLGIVYTPVEVVDFIVHSVEVILQQEFGVGLGTPGVQILDPFTGAGAFVTRLLQSGLLTKEQLQYKYRHDIYANEIVLLAYYIAAINIESVYHSLMAQDAKPEPVASARASRGQGNVGFGSGYVPFAGICLTDTFQLQESSDLLGQLLVDNSARRVQQRQARIQVIIGNPPYSVGQRSANDNNQNLAYPGVDGRIRATYAARSSATNKNALYDSYIRAIRWASDRIGESGVVGFVTNAGFVDSNVAAGVRKCLAEEFSSLYIFHLRGNARTAGELRRKEKDNVFGMGSRAPIAISLLVKAPPSQDAAAAARAGNIYFYDIGDYLSREDKLAKIRELGSIAGITAIKGWQHIIPDPHGDWLQQRTDSFAEFIALGDKGGKETLAVFENYSLGVATSRDAWCYNASRNAVAANMERMIAFYNSEVARFAAQYAGLDKKAREAKVADFINLDLKKISWDVAQRLGVAHGRFGTYTDTTIVSSLYRPFTKRYLYFDRFFNNRTYQMPRIFPTAVTENMIIMINSKWQGIGNIALMGDKIPDLHCNGDAQCFPLYLYDTAATTTPTAQSGQAATDQDLFTSPTNPKTSTDAPKRHYAITAAALSHWQNHYPTTPLSQEDLFYYIYAILHHPTYRERYAANLSKQLPRIPAVAEAADFLTFTQAGRQLAELHTNYDQAALYPVTIHIKPELNTTLTPMQLYRVTKMRYGKTAGGKDLTTIIYNDYITLTDIPAGAYQYVVNGKSAIDWVVERQGSKTDKDTGISNDANAWANETMHNPKYPLELLQRVITVSLETMRIIAAMPEL